MTWGSNASGDIRPCPHCGFEMIDNDDTLGFMHLQICPNKPKKTERAFVVLLLFLCFPFGFLIWMIFQ